jgi:hypothetical protein
LMGGAKRRRDQMRWGGIYSAPVMCALLYAMGPTMGALLLAAYACAGATLFARGGPTRVDAGKHAAQSSAFPNLSVLVGGSTLADTSRDFPWRVAAAEWLVPNAFDIVVIDIDNVMDDYARWALTVATDLIIPMGLNVFDFERLCVDPREGGLFPTVITLNNTKLKYRAVILNRVKCYKNLTEEDEPGLVDEYEFHVATAERTMRDRLLDKFRGQIGHGFVPCMMRELSGKIVTESQQLGRPICLLDQADKATAAATANLELIANKIFQ